MDSAEAIVAAAVNGAGIVSMPLYLLATDIAQGRLQTILQGFEVEALPIGRSIRRGDISRLRFAALSIVLFDAWQPVPPWEREVE